MYVPKDDWLWWALLVLSGLVMAVGMVILIATIGSPEHHDKIRVIADEGSFAAIFPFVCSLGVLMYHHQKQKPRRFE